MSLKNPSHWFRKVLFGAILLGGMYALFSSHESAPVAASAQLTHVPLQWIGMDTTEDVGWPGRFGHLTLLIEGHEHACDVYKKGIDEHAARSGHAIGHKFAVMKLKGNPYLDVRYANPVGNFDCTVQVYNVDKPKDQTIEQIGCDVNSGSALLPLCIGGIASQERLYAP
ncbi:MAG: hypothetical protein NT003_02770 [Candidatus Magasanikbacteria bacterium]|nr:hypothetical protein [Candidatus Magasanikbacteria bacterium]